MKVSVSTDGPPFRLLVTSHGRTAVAGPRVFRGGILPAIQWSHYDTQNAQIHADKLQAYFDELPGAKKPSKRALRAFGA
jgi:hypothetical protein